MASAVAHSLRNPMASIRSSAELWHSGLPPDERWAAAEVIAEVDRMDGYVRDLLAYARAEPYQLQAVDFAKVAGRVIGKYAQAIKRYRIEVAGGIEAAPVRVMADEMLLEQALNSIVTNAIEAMPTGGRLDLSVVPATEADRVRIAVVDSGAGIPGEIIDRVAHSYFTTKARGLGLGLVLAKGIIERFGGQLTIASQPGAGTTVAIELRSA
nr:HAMP domain-containing sensor histidine kinase [Prosthecomicrobium hirschii]